MSEGLDARIAQVVGEVLDRRDRDSRFKVQDINKDISPDALQQINDYLSNINPINVAMKNVRGFLTTGAMVVVERKELAAAAGSFDFQNIPQQFKHLRLLLYARGTDAVLNHSCLMRYNGDSGSNYYSQWIIGQQTGPPGTGFEEAVTYTYVGGIPCASATSGSFGTQEIFIPFYTSANRKSHVVSAYRLNLPAIQTISITGGNWSGTAAINRIQILPFAGSFTAGSVATLYVHN